MEQATSQIPMDGEVEVHDDKSCFEGKIVTFDLHCETATSIETFLEITEEKSIQLLRDLLKKHQRILVSFTLVAVYEVKHLDDVSNEICTENKIFASEHEIVETVKKMKLEIFRETVEYEDCNRVRLKKISCLRIKVHKFVENNFKPISRELTKLTFKNSLRLVKVPFVIYARFEVIYEPVGDKLVEKPYTFGYYLKCSYDDTLSKYRYYPRNSPDDCAKTFWKFLEEDARDISQHLQENETKKTVDANIFEEASSCYVCKKIFGSPTEKVADYSKFSDFVGICHFDCRVQTKVPNFVPVITPNLAIRDSNFLMRALTRNDQVDVIQNIQGEFIAITKKIGNIQIRCVDFRKFINDKLRNLSPSLQLHQKKHLKLLYDEDLELIDKTSFNYRHFESVDALTRTGPFPREFFKNKHGDIIPDSTYRWFLEVWRRFDCRMLLDFLEKYAQSRIMLCTDIFENFRTLIIGQHGLDPAHYFSTPGLTWDAMLKFTGIELELLNDPEMTDFIIPNLRGGLMEGCKLRAQANNKCLDNYEKTNTPSFIVDFDANNLYGWAMTQPLPYEAFTWMRSEDFGNLKANLMEISDNNEFGYILEVDLDYPTNLHESHNDLPFCPQKLMVPPPPVSTKLSTQRLVTNLYNKRNYVIHYRNLKQCIANGLELKKIHRVLKFRQLAWLKQYMEFNASLRKKASSHFEKKFYKSLNNLIFGKTIERDDKKMETIVATNWENIKGHLGAQRVIGRNFDFSYIINEDVAVFQRKLQSKQFRWPISAGFTVLELSKLLMYDFHYQHMRLKYDNRIHVLDINTDSFVYEIETEDFYADLDNDDEFASFFDTSGMPKVGKINNKEVLGKMKDVWQGKICREFRSLGARAYIVKFEGEDQNCLVKIKELSRNEKKRLLFDDFEFEPNEPFVREVRTKIREDNLVVTKAKKKIYIENGGGKRLVLPNKINTLAWGFHGSQSNNF